MNDKKKLDLENYKGHSKKESTKYVWWIEESVDKNLKELTSYNNETYPSVVLRYILDWSCDKVEKDEVYRKHMEDITLNSNNSSEGKIKRSYTLNKDVNDRVHEIRNKYRFFNLTVFINESVKWFIKEH